MINGSSYSCIFNEINGDLTLLNVSNFKTPLGVLKDAQIRMEDVESITFDKTSLNDINYPSIHAATNS
jgi:hypothetical protein